MIKIHPSSLGLIMTEPKKKEDVLSVGAKTYIKKLAKEFVYGYKESIQSKYLDKGNAVESESIALYNSVFGTSHIKNTERRENEYLCGECDIDTGEKIIDVKSSWSLSTFPCFTEDASNKDYEWQVRAYMILWDRDYAEVAHCMVSTPDELIRYEPLDIHLVDGIEESLRVTVVKYQRDIELDSAIEIKCKAAQEYFNEMIDKIATEHNYGKAKQ